MKQYIWPIITVGLLIALIFSVKSCSKAKGEKAEAITLAESIFDSLVHLKNKDSINVATISAITTESSKTFTGLQTKDSEIRKLQEVVKDYQKKLKAGSSVTNAVIETAVNNTQPTVIVKADTVRKDSLVYVYPVYTSTLTNKWIDYSSRANKDTSVFNLKVTNEFSAVVGYHKRRPFVDLLTENPYTTVKELRTYQVKVPKPKKFGIGPQVGVMFLPEFNPNLRIQTSVYVGVGISYNPIRF